MTQIAQSISSSRNANERYRMERSAAAENASRLAQSTTTLRTFGVGSIIIAAPARFDMPFTHEPAVAAGFALAKATNAAFQLPIATIGVRQWVKEGALFTAALLYVSVVCDVLPDGLRPLLPYETKTQSEAYSSAHSLGLPYDYLVEIGNVGSGDLSPGDRGALEAAWDEMAPQWLKQVTIVHSITFSGIAMKDVPTEGVDGDPALTPRTSVVGIITSG